MSIQILLFSLIAGAATIYEDQIGKFDWRRQHVGCPHQLHLEKPDNLRPGLAFVATDADIIAAIKTSTGEIVLITVSKNTEIVRAWERDTGVLMWETQIAPQLDRFSQVLIIDAVVFIIRNQHIVAITLSNGQIKWERSISSNEDRIGAVDASETLVVLGGVKNVEVIVSHHNKVTGEIVKERKIMAPWFNNQRCTFSHTVMLCFDDYRLYALNFLSDKEEIRQSTISAVKKISSLNDNNVFAAITDQNTIIYRLDDSNSLTTLLTLEKVNALNAIISSNGHVLLSVALKNAVTVYDLDDGKALFTSKVDEGIAIAQMAIMKITKEIEFLTVRENCRTDYSVGSDNQLILEWTREEALSEISAVEMVDLPLSEAQAGIEAEFISNGGGIIESLIRRLRSQVEQVRRSFFGALKTLMSSSALLSFNSKSIVDWFSSINQLPNSRIPSNADTPMERDYFNLRKIIVASTLRSTIYGIDSSDGSILWHLFLGDDVVPLYDSLDGHKTPLFIQRSTAHYRFPPQAAVVVAEKMSKYAVLVFFNPVNGSLIEKRNLQRVAKRVEMLPFTDPISYLHHLLIVDSENNVIIYPDSKMNLEQLLPIYSFEFSSNGYLEGFIVNLTRLEFSKTWSMNLGLTPQQKIIAVASKPLYQRVHSSGRVLGNRSVLYKYSNPNLVAVAAVDSTHSILHIFLIDVISGYVVYNARQNKVSGPIHLVHCENWLTYSYWNEKGRRMELAVIELYEGLEQTDATQYNSLMPTIASNIEALSQAYIFPQGISALGVTETEQGLSTRSIIVAMPFGGLYGISKRILDARRPLEMTQELAEEMLLPYRPEIPVAFEDFINYNQSVHAIRAIKTSPSGLESTSLMLAYGLDLFFSRLTPSGTFDILKDDFDHLLISVVLAALVVGSMVCKKLGTNNNLKQSWQ